MKSHLTYIDKSTWTYDEWMDFRLSGLGGSDIGTIISIPDPDGSSEILTGFNKYESATQLFYKKLGIVPQYKEDKIEMFMGNYLEDSVADLWSYHDGTIEGMMRNYKNGVRIKKARNFNSIIVNPKYPWLFANLDRVINKEYNPLQINEEGILECKTIDKFAADQWQSGIPEYYIFQVQAYMIIADLQYSEIAMLKSGRHLEVFPIKRSDIICEQIILQSEIFWKRVTTALPLVAEMKIYQAQGRFDLAEQAEAEIDSYAPSADSSPAFTAFYKEKYKRGDGGERAGTPEEYRMAINHIKAQGNIKHWQQIETQYKNQLMEALKHTETIRFEEKERVEWKMRNDGIRVFKNYVKDEKS